MWHIATQSECGTGEGRTDVRKYHTGRGAVRTLYSYQNGLCGVFRAHVNVQGSKKCQALSERLGMDGE
jgi:hypothetical protein